MQSRSQYYFMLCMHVSWYVTAAVMQQLAYIMLVLGSVSIQILLQKYRVYTCVCCVWSRILAVGSHGVMYDGCQDCLLHFSKEEKMTGDSRWDCPRCKCKRDATKRLVIWRLPPILLIILKRFANTNLSNCELVRRQEQHPVSVAQWLERSL